MQYILSLLCHGNPGPFFDLPCQVWAYPIFNKGGDSGSPVFTDFVISGKIELIGILWGRSGRLLT